ncbi:MAG: hypothetical protein JXK07_07930 [Spirochaetes bacterium]|nr:hypothetical protein [Spirochaetota bacterium]MBN2770034.1 hypothetical protein [Spirochaetota bacterium]
MKSKKSDLLWLSICVANAAVGSVLGIALEFNKAAMSLGVVVFVMLFLCLSRTGFYNRLIQNVVLYRSIIMGYFINALLFPLHIYSGCAAAIVIDKSGRLLGLKNISNTDFFQTLLMTLITGICLNIIAAFVIAIVYYLQKLTLTVAWKISEKDNSKSDILDDCRVIE